MAKVSEFNLVEDKKGVMWDLVLYIPTLIALSLLASKYWFSGDQTVAYVLLFLTSFIFLIAFNRIFKTRLMMLPSSPIGLAVSKKGVKINLKNGSEIELVNDVRFFTDMAGKSFGLAGTDQSGDKKQFIFHKGQFTDPAEYDFSKAQLRAFK